MSRPETALEASGLGKCYGKQWALRGCNLSVPAGVISALVGPNGAGKTTLLRVLVGLARATEGVATVFGSPVAQTPHFLQEVGYLAQDVPLYKRLTAEDHIRIGQALNQRWEAEAARGRLRELRVPTDRPVSTLSGGQRAQVALALALAKRPRLLLLDEPVAALDPLARRGFLTSLAAAVADGDLTVVLSSHLIKDIERVCDHVVLLREGETRLCAPIEEIVATHRGLVGPRQKVAHVEGVEVVHATHSSRQSRLLVKLASAGFADPAWVQEEVDLEEIVLAYMGVDDEQDSAPLSAVGGSR
jgi:ABC-2 type transport system ATP-binding protein